MIRQFTTKRDIVSAFANTMNLVSPELQDHHEKVSYLAYRLAEALDMDERHRVMAFAGGLLHDIGGILKQGGISLSDLEMSAGQVAAVGASILKTFPVTSPLAAVVRESQTPWQRLKSIHADLKLTHQIGQIVHLADAVSLLLNDESPVLNQIGQVQQMIHCDGESEFSPELLSAFDMLCSREAIWMDMIYRPQFFLDLITENRFITLDETVILTEFMSKIIDFRSPFTAMHSAGVATTAVALAELVGMSEDECKMMRIAGYLHDIGKLKIPNEILDKPGKLTDEEFNIMKEHAYYTWIILKDVGGFEQISAWAALHHEKLNGSGYPFHLGERELSLGSRIMTVADIFSALTEERPYRKSMEKERVVTILREDAQRGLLSGSVADLLIEHYDAINGRRAVESKAASKKYQEILAQKNAQYA